jgi:hypothetical protein
MSGGIRAGKAPSRKRPAVAAERRVVPMQVGSATVYIEQFGDLIVVESEGAIRTVALPSSSEVFEKGGDILHECVRVIGERIEAMAEKARPKKVTVEFSISFEVRGKASVIPVFLTGETGGQTGLKVTAEWTRADAKEG